MGTFRNLQHEGVDPLGLSRWFDDFFKFTAGEWTITTTEAGAGAATEAITPAANGVLLITNDDADADADYLQGAETFKFVSGKQMKFKARWKVSDATDSAAIIGLVITDTTPLANTDGIYFVKPDTDTGLDFVVNKDSTATTQADVGVVANDTWIETEFYYDGGTEIDVYVDGALVAAVAITNAPDDEELAITFGVVNGAAAAKTLSIDYIEVVAER